jgi:PST family polysaccharide transporter
VAGAASVVILISLDASLVAITAALTGQILLKSVLNTIVYQLAGAPLTRLRATLAWARSVLALGWPLALSSVAIGLYQRIDVVMLGELAGATETGLYNAAARLSDAGTFVGVAIATSAAPGLIHMHATNDPRYGASLVRFATILFYLGVSGALFVTLINEPLIRLLYGPKFAGSAAILQIHIWSAPFIFLGHLVMRWLIVERLMHFEITRTIVAALINISLNFVLIPLYGGIGAALATIASNLVSGYLVCFLFPSTRSAAMFITQGMVFPLTWSLARVSRALNRPRGPRETLPADD